MVVAHSYNMSQKRPHPDTVSMTVRNNNCSIVSERNSIVTERSSIVTERNSLPVCLVKAELMRYLKRNETSIVIGETGCGKSTQIPQYCLEANLNVGLSIAVTQPRRVAAVTLATRVAMEMDTMLGEQVGYTVRFERMASDETRLVYMTDGMLLREALHDPLLSRYGIVMVDEAHERSLHTDIVLWLVKRSQQERRLTNSTQLPPLKIVVMSATMDTDMFSEYLSRAPVYFIHGRTFPIQLYYAPSLHSSDDYLYNALVTVMQLHQSEPIQEDILVFLTGQEEIESAVRRTRELARGMERRLQPSPLYAAMHTHAQLKVLARLTQPVLARLTQPNIRKVIFATNIAETSLTIPGIRIVVDTGKIKIRRFEPQTSIDVLRVINVSQASANQRTGRAGREAPGKCYRLYGQADFERFSPMSEAEIERCNLSCVLLELIRLNIGKLDALPLIYTPTKEAIKVAVDQLNRLGAIESTDDDQSPFSYALTDLGSQLVDFPLDPKFAKVLTAASSLGCLEEALLVVACMCQENMFVLQPVKKEEAEAARNRFRAAEGDHVTMMNVFKEYRKMRRSCEVKAIKEWCMNNFVQKRHLETINKVLDQLKEICKKRQFKMTSCGRDMTPLRRALCEGLFLNACELNGDGYRLVSSPRSPPIKIHPSSCLARSRPTFFVFSDLLRTSELYARDITVIDGEWLSQMAMRRTEQDRRKKIDVDNVNVDDQ